ncbi:lysine-specific demethylase 8-like [Asterias rubens]|uniref:lysine-specific demethylase 8-like n=1 Tax=Asterias rubens TaxID=7604 RepID=UPI0014557426|nr:lysine-specific demethylase 8-like [Asterias rubens]
MERLPHVRTLLPKNINELHLEDILKETVGHDVHSLLQDCAEDVFQSDLQQSSAKSEDLLNFSWEKLNTGHWKDVNIAWRHVYSYASLLKVMSIYGELDEDRDGLQAQLVERALEACDMGLLMGAPILDNILSHLARALQKSFKATSSTDHREVHPKCLLQEAPVELPSLLQAPVISKQHEIPRVTCPSLLHFYSQFMETKTPVIIQGAMDHWPAMGARQWSLRYLHEVAGQRTIPIELGAKYTDESWSQSLMTLSNFITKYIQEKALTQGKDKVGYLAQHQLFHQIPELRDDICVPDYCCIHDNTDNPNPISAEDDLEDATSDDENLDDEVDINAWFGPAGTVSPLHTDPKHNCLSQVVGEKYIRLYGEDMTPSVYPHQSHLLHNTSQVDVENPDVLRFPLFPSAIYQEAILRPGEMLYIPRGCWHYVRSLSTSFSVSFWWM